jgi:hypothetical protein
LWYFTTLSHSIQHLTENKANFTLKTF